MSESNSNVLRGILIFMAVIWGAFLLDWLLPLDLSGTFALQPRRVPGLVGIVSMPFVHANYGHLMANTVPLVVLLFLLAGSKADSRQIVVGLVVLGGGLLWVFGRNANHIGASGLVFGLATFLIVGGVMERKVISIVVAVLVWFLYGGSLLSGVMPSQEGISWDGHLCGAVAGVLMAVSRSNVLRERNQGGRT